MPASAALAEIDEGVPRRDAVAAHLHERAGDLELAARLYAAPPGARRTSLSGSTSCARRRA